MTGCRAVAARDMSAQPYTLLSLPIASKTMATYYYQDEIQTDFFFLKPEYAEQSVHFTAQEASVHLHSDGVDSVETDWRYYEAGRFYQNGNVYTLIMYNFPGEFDDPYFNVQLNGYNAAGELLDAVVLDMRYVFEDVEAFSEYTIENNNVTIRQYVGYYWDADNLVAGLVFKPIHQLFCTKTYAIENGYFIQLSEEKYPVAFINKSRDEE